MITEYYGKLKVDWTDGEYKRLELIRQKREKAIDAGTYEPPQRSTTGGNNAVAINLYMSPLLKEKTKEYAKANGVSVSALVKGMLEALVDDNT